MSEIKQGRIVRIQEAGLCFVSEVDSNKSYVFSFDKVPNYRGQTAEELGLKLGSVVYFTVTAGGNIFRAALTSESLSISPIGKAAGMNH